MRQLVLRFIADQIGATAIEYALIATGISIVILASVNSIGTSVSNTERRIVDPETGRTLPPGQLGVLQLRGGTVMLGMHRK